MRAEPAARRTGSRPRCPCPSTGYDGIQFVITRRAQMTRLPLPCTSPSPPAPARRPRAVVAFGGRSRDAIVQARPARRAARRDGPASASSIDLHACSHSTARQNAGRPAPAVGRGKRRRRSSGVHARDPACVERTASVSAPKLRWICRAAGALGLAHQIRWCFRGRFSSGKTSFGRFVFPASH
jgi:hypothetical protein